MSIQATAILIGLKRTGKGNKTKFVINDNDIKWAQQVMGNIRPWLLEHYQMTREFANYQTSEAMPDRSNLTGMDLIYYHIHGDYRLAITERDAARKIHRSPQQRGVSITLPSLRFKTYPLHEEEDAVFRRSDISLLSHEFLPYLSSYHRKEKYDHLHGFQPRDEGGRYDVRPEYSNFAWAEVDWFVDRLARGQQDDLFFLPSLGTMLTSLSTFADVGLSLKQYFAGKGERIAYMWETVRKNRELENRLPWFQDTSGQPFIDAGVDGARADRNYPSFFLDWTRAIVEHPDYQQLIDEGALGDEHTQQLWNAAFRASTREDEDGYFDVDKGANLWCNHLFQSDTSLGMGQAVRLEDKREKRGTTALLTFRKAHERHRPATWAALEWESFEEATGTDLEATWFISDIRQVGDVFRYRMSQVNDEGEVVELPGEFRPTQLVFMDELGDELEDDEKQQAYALDYARKNRSSARMTYIRIVLDTYFTMETMAQLIDNKIARNRFSKFQRKDQDQYIEQGLPTYPRWSSGGKKSPGLGEFLCDARLEYLGGYLASLHAMYREGAKAIETLYGSDLMKAEIAWYSANLSARQDIVQEDEMRVGGTIAHPISGEESRLERHEVTAPRMAQEGPTIQLFASLTPQTVFYRVDAPLLRDIYEEYSARHNNFIIRASRAIDRGPIAGKKVKDPKTGKKVKFKGTLLPKLWSMVEQNMSLLFDTPDFEPHQLWIELRGEMEGHRARYGPDRPMSPPEWAGSVFWHELETNPRHFGKEVDLEENRKRINEFMAFAKTHYFTDYSLLSRLATAIDRTRIRSIHDLSDLRQHMLTRIITDNKDTLLGYTKWPAFRNFIYVMRQYIAADQGALAHAVAERAGQAPPPPADADEDGYVYAPPEEDLPPSPEELAEHERLRVAAREEGEAVVAEWRERHPEGPPGPLPTRPPPSEGYFSLKEDESPAEPPPPPAVAEPEAEPPLSDLEEPLLPPVVEERWFSDDDLSAPRDNPWALDSGKAKSESPGVWAPKKGRQYHRGPDDLQGALFSKVGGWKLHLRINSPETFDNFGKVDKWLWENILPTYKIGTVWGFGKDATIYVGSHGDALFLANHIATRIPQLLLKQERKSIPTGDRMVNDYVSMRFDPNGRSSHTNEGRDRYIAKEHTYGPNGLMGAAGYTGGAHKTSSVRGKAKERKILAQNMITAYGEDYAFGDKRFNKTLKSELETPEFEESDEVEELSPPPPPPTEEAEVEGPPDDASRQEAMEVAVRGRAAVAAEEPELRKPKGFTFPQDIYLIEHVPEEGNPHTIIVVNVHGWGPQGFYRRSDGGGQRANPQAVAGDFVPFDGIDAFGLYYEEGGEIPRSGWLVNHRFTGTGNPRGRQSDKRPISPPYNAEYAGWGNKKFMKVGQQLSAYYEAGGELEEESTHSDLEVNWYLHSFGAPHAMQDRPQKVTNIIKQFERNQDEKFSPWGGELSKLMSSIKQPADSLLYYEPVEFEYSHAMGEDQTPYSNPEVMVAW